MSLANYHLSQQLDIEDIPLEALVMAALRRAEGQDWEALDDAFPDISDEFTHRFNVPDGLLNGEEAA